MSIRNILVFFPAILLLLLAVTLGRQAAAQTPESITTLTGNSGIATATSYNCGTVGGCCAPANTVPFDGSSCAYVAFQWKAAANGTATFTVDTTISDAVGLYVIGDTYYYSSYFYLSQSHELSLSTVAGTTYSILIGAVDPGGGDSYSTGSVTVDYSLPAPAVPGPPVYSDGPLPLWAYAVLAFTMWRIALRQTNKQDTKHATKA